MNDLENNNTNMYQKPPIISNLNQILANLSIGDTKHDFNYSNNVLNNIKFKDPFNSALPDNFDLIQDEETCLNSVIKTYTTSDANGNDVSIPVSASNETYIPLTAANKEYNRRKKGLHSITTVNNNEYTVNYSTVRHLVNQNGAVKSEYIDGVEFFSNFDLNNETNIALVIDATSIGLIEILSTGNFETSKRPNVYYIYGPEIINDPAFKTPPGSNALSSKNGVNFISCISMNPSTFIYNYEFTKTPSPNTTYLEQFFTNYSFNLSDTRSIINGKQHYQFKTDLTVNSNNPSVSPNIIIDSTYKNNITYLSNIINKLRKSLKETKDIFLLNSSLQQKRSGDWLQVLLCAGLLDKSRPFKEYPDGKTNITREIQQVFFVTHDKIALAFALLNGIECIFTHFHLKSYIYSVFIYKLKDPFKQRQNVINLANTYKSKIDEIKNNIINSINKVQKYQKEVYETYVNHKILLMNKKLDGYFTTLQNISTTNMPLDVQYNFNDVVRNVFSDAIILIFYKKLLPDLSKQYDFLQTLTNNEFAELSRLINIDNSLDNPSEDITPDNSLEIISNYNNIIENIKNINNIVTKTNNSLNTLEKNLINLKKTQFYISATNWDWNTGIINRRDIPTLTVSTETKNYGSDRNIFLYNINEIDEIIKQKIVLLFKEYYDFILSKCEIIVPDNINDYFVETKLIKGEKNPVLFNEFSFTKFKAVSLSFCIENMISNGGNGINLSSVKQLKPNQILDIIDSFLSKDKSYNKLLNDNIIVEEDMNFNIDLQNNTFTAPFDSFNTISKNVNILENDSDVISNAVADNIINAVADVGTNTTIAEPELENMDIVEPEQEPVETEELEGTEENKIKKIIEKNLDFAQRLFYDVN